MCLGGVFLYRKKTKLQIIAQNKYVIGAKFILSGLIVIILVLLLFSALMTKMDMSESAVTAFATAALSIGAFVTGYTSGKKKRKNGLINGLFYGLLLYLLLFFLGLPIVREGISALCIVKLAVILLFSAAGGIKGVNTRLRFSKRY